MNRKVSIIVSCAFAALFLVLGFRYLQSTKEADQSSWEDVDSDGDGRIDCRYIYDHEGTINNLFRDRNGDGNWDSWEYYEHDAVVRIESDENFDGKVDVWIDYDPTGLPVTVRQDVDFDGKPDVEDQYVAGVIDKSVWSTNHFVWKTVFYKDGITISEDAHINGRHRIRTFDAFGEILSETFNN